MKCNYYSYWMTNCPMIFGDKALICCRSCCCCCCLIWCIVWFSARTANLLYLFVKSARWKWAINEAILIFLHYCWERRKSIFISIARWMWNAIVIREKGELKKRTATVKRNEKWRDKRKPSIRIGIEILLWLVFVCPQTLKPYLSPHWKFHFNRNVSEPYSNLLNINARRSPWMEWNGTTW